MKELLAVFMVMLFLTGCIKPPNELVTSFWDPASPAEVIGTVIDSTYQLNNTNERVYLVKFNIAWDKIPEIREGSILSVKMQSNGTNIPIVGDRAYNNPYSVYFFAPPAKTSCLTFSLLTSTGGISRPFDLMCVQVP